MCWSNGIDWSATGDLWAGVGSLAAGAAAIFLAIYAKRGLTAWKDQQLGVKKLDLAQDLLAEVFTVEEVLKFIVSPFVGASELGAVEKLDGETDSDYDLRRTYDAVIKRYDDHADHFSKVRALAFRARATLGEDVYSAVKDLLLIRSSIQTAAQRGFQTSRQVDRLERRAQLGFEVTIQEYDAASAAMRDAQDRFWGMGDGETLEREIDRKASRCAEALRAVITSVLGD